MASRSTARPASSAWTDEHATHPADHQVARCRPNDRRRRPSGCGCALGRGGSRRLLRANEHAGGDALAGRGADAARSGARAIDRVIGYQRDYGFTFWIVERKADGELLGFCGLKRVNDAGARRCRANVEIGWRLREDAWGQGYAREAAIASLDLAFGRFGAPHVVAFTVAGNRASWGLMERLGMTRRADLDFVDPRFGPSSTRR